MVVVGPNMKYSATQRLVIATAAPVACLRQMRGSCTPGPFLFPLQQRSMPLQHSRAPQNHQHCTKIVEDGVYLRVTAFVRGLVRDYRLHMP